MEVHTTKAVKTHIYPQTHDRTSQRQTERTAASSVRVLDNDMGQGGYDSGLRGGDDLCFEEISNIFLTVTLCVQQDITHGLMVCP